MAITISVAMQKGGVGKTTTSQALASTLGKKKKRVLYVDTDSQCNASLVSGVESDNTLYSIYKRQCSIEDAIVKCNLYDLICADGLLGELEQDSKLDTFFLKDILAAVQNKYDFIIIDTPPALGNLLFSSLLASDYMIIPAEARPLSLNGLDQLQATIEAVQCSNKALKVLGVLIVKYNNRTVLNRQIKDAIDERTKQMNTTVFKTTIREGVAVPEAQTMQMPLLEYAPKSNPNIDYEQFVKEVLKRIGGMNNGK